MHRATKIKRVIYHEMFMYSLIHTYEPKELQKDEVRKEVSYKHAPYLEINFRILLL